MLAAPDIDVVYNSLPNSLHSEWTVKAAEAGKHVLCEKPLPVTIAELEDVQAAAARKRVTVFEAIDPYLCEVRAVEACVLDGAEPVVSLDRSRDFLKSVPAAYESAHTGNSVHV